MIRIARMAAAAALAAVMYPAFPASAEDMDLDVCPSDYSGFPADAPKLTCGCTPEAMRIGDVFGAGPYYWQSSVCAAAAHAGALGRQGGRISVTPVPEVSVFPAVRRNGIASHSWPGGSGNIGFRVALAEGAPAAAPDPAAVPAAGMALDVCPSDYSGFEANAPTLTCGCTPDAIKTGDVFGANPFYWQSSVCGAARHAGVLGAQGGQIVVSPSSPVPVYPAVTRNGVKGKSWLGSGVNQGFEIAPLPGAAPAVPTAAPVKTSADGMLLDVCPSDYGNFGSDAPAMTCGCAPEAMKGGDVFGANPYYWQSSVCSAAQHAGMLSARGGTIVVTPSSPVPVFPNVKRNGVEGRAWQGGNDNQGFVIATLPPAPPAVGTATPVQMSTEGMALDVCPSDYADFPADAPRLNCGCAPDAVKAGDVFGANPYYWQSSVCRAAFHAGVVGAPGGRIVVTPAADVPVFPGVPRNGVTSRSWAGGGGNQGFRVAGLPGAPAPAVPAPKPTVAAKVDAAGQPVQAPVAQTLKETGQVALYIRFRFNSADLDIGGAPTLMQLRDALTAAPDMRLLLVGHTDAVGGRDYNRDLSLKRAQAVMLWLRDQGIPPQRLAIDGKGFDEPVADNASDSGRALNRRVQAIRIQ